MLRYSFQEVRRFGLLGRRAASGLRSALGDGDAGLGGLASGTRIEGGGQKLRGRPVLPYA